MKRALVALAIVLGAGPASAQEEPPPVVTESVLVTPVPEEERPTPIVVDELGPTTVLTIDALGFAADTTGQVAQCLDGIRCRNALNVRFDGAGRATFQYLITDDFVPGARGCRLGHTSCTIELQAADDVAVIHTVFVDRAPPPGVLEIESGDVVIGDTVDVTARALPAHVDLTLTICASLATSGSRCGAPGPVVEVTTDASGTARATLTVPAEVGSDRVACGRRVECRVVVASEDVTVRARPVAIAFEDAPGAHYDPPRVLAGIVLAIGLIAVAAWLIRSTDWRPPPEADSTLIDEAEYADLDREAAIFEDAASGA